jgi:hypothetical protein
MKTTYMLLVSFLLAKTSFAQPSENGASKRDSLPYCEIPPYPDTFTAENVAARMIDGLGFRFYWATEGLRPEDLAFQPSPGARNCEATIDHILGLSNMILNAVKKQPNVRSDEATSPLGFAVKRKQTLENLEMASVLLRQSKGELDDFDIVFVNGDRKTEFPFWNLLNGPIADALWHVGQVVTFRRSSGNPFNPKVNVLAGKLRP